MELNRIVLIALGTLTVARLLLLSATELDPDEAYVALCGTRSDWHYMESGPLPPLLSRIGTAVFGRNEFGHRFFAPFFGLGMTLAGGALTAGIASGRASVWAISGITLLPAMGIASTRMTVETCSAFFFSVLAWSIWSALHSHRLSRRFWILAGASAAGALLCHPANIIPLALSCCLLAVVPRWRRNLLKGKFLFLMLPLIGLGLVPYFAWEENHRILASLHWQGDFSGNTSLTGIADLLRRSTFAYTPLIGFGLLWIVYWDLRHNRNSLGARYGIAFSLPLILFALGLAFLGKPSPLLLLPAAIPLLARLALTWPGVPVSHSLKIAVRTTALAFAALFSLLISQTDLVRRAGMTWGYRDTPPQGGGHSYWTPWIRDASGEHRGWRELARLVDHIRKEAVTSSGETPFLIASSSEVAALLAFYLPEVTDQKNSIKATAGGSSKPTDPPVFDIVGQNPTSALLGWARYNRREKTTINSETERSPSSTTPTRFGDSALFIATPALGPGEIFPPALKESFSDIWPVVSANILRGGELLRTVTVYSCDDFHGKGL